MDSVNILLLLVVAGSLLALFYVARRYKDSELEHISAKAERSGNSANEKEQEQSSGHPQITIYAYVDKSGSRRCPYCDGETPTGAKICSICGRDI